MFENLEKWTESQGSCADTFIQSAIEKFYPKATNDSRLRRFFEDADIDADSVFAKLKDLKTDQDSDKG